VIRFSKRIRNVKYLVSCEGKYFLLVQKGQLFDIKVLMNSNDPIAQLLNPIDPVAPPGVENTNSSAKPDHQMKTFAKPEWE
jgi:hypothetical protein